MWICCWALGWDLPSQLLFLTGALAAGSVRSESGGLMPWPRRILVQALVYLMSIDFLRFL